jgi:hypothetical protein
VARLLARQQGKLFREVRTHVLADQQATRAGILAALESLRGEVREGDLVVFYLCAHGTDYQGVWFCVPSDFDCTERSPKLVTDRDIAERLGNLSAPSVVFLESCHSGAAGRSRTTEASIQSPGVAWFAGCQAEEEGILVYSWQSGLFTQALTEGLEGRADANGDGVVTVGELSAYIRARSAELLGEFNEVDKRRSVLARNPDWKPHRQHPEYHASGTVQDGLAIARVASPKPANPAR